MRIPCSETFAGPVHRRQFLVGAVAASSHALLAPSATAQSPSTVASPWRHLFNGKNLDGWTVYQQGNGNRDAHRAIAVEGGMLHFLGPRFDGPDSASFGHLATAAEEQDFHLRVDFRWGERRFAPRKLQRRNSGILYHMGPERDRLFPDAVEYQVEEGDVGDAVMINTRALHGPLLGGTPLWPKFFPGMPRVYESPVSAGGISRQWFRHSGNYERLEGWNRLEIYAFGDQAAHLVNGRIVTTLFGLVDRAGAPLRRGRIALEFEAAEVFFRTIAIRSLGPREIEDILAGR